MEPLAADDPRQAGVFRLQARLGAGGMGRVYLGSSPGGRAVAVKIVHPELARDPEFMTRFRHEVRAAEAVSGAYTAPVIGAGPDDHPPWLATAFVAGPSLAELVAGSGPLPEAAVWRLAGGLVEALQAIHGRGLVHRDLKPGNILIAVDGPRVIDFGISRALRATALTDARTTMGTPVYMSPEQAEGAAIGPPSDVFSLGSVVAFAATGSAPFDGGETFAIAYRIVHGQPDLSRVPPALRGLVAGCLAKDPASRPSLARLIDAVAAGSASFPGIAPGKFWPEPVATLVAGQTSPVPGLAPAITARPPAAQPATAPPPGAPGTSPVPRRRNTHRGFAAAGGIVVAAAAVGAALALVLHSGSGSGGAPADARHTASGTAGALVQTSAPAGPATSSSAATSPATPPASSPATSPSPASSLIAITVCTTPAAGCTLPGAAQLMEIRPKVITASGDGSVFVTRLAWSSWGGSRATATGTLEVNNCTPNCAQGKYTGYPATVTLAGLKPYGSGLEAYSTIVVQSPAAGVTDTYTRDTLP